MHAVLIKVTDGDIRPPEYWNPVARQDSGRNGAALAHCPGGQVPESLSAVAMKALSLKREDRYQSVKEFQMEIEAWQGGYATQAEQAGLEFLALTDHAEWETYINLEHDYTLNIWEKTLELAARAEGGPVLPVVAFEWTGAYENKDGENIGGHRIVYFEDLDPCEEFWKSAGEREQAKSAWGLESYTLRSRAAGKPQVLVEALEATAEICGATRWLSWFHHTAYSPPRPVAWSEDVNRMLNDSVVEILSEHGSSECYDTTLEGSRWNVNMDRWAGKGSVQEALQVGLHLGFVGGTDNHEARPGSVEDGAGPIASYYDENGDGYEDPYHFMTAPGSITGVLYAGAELDRPALFDGIEARNTVAATWLFDEVRVVAVGQDGEVYLPGSEVPAIASPLRLVVEIGEEVMDTWQILLLDPWNNVHAMAEERRLDTDIDLAPGDARYLRVDAWSDKVQHRLWVSPFFGVE